MITYNFENIKGPMYIYLYNCLKRDILSGVLKPDEKLPSKRTFAENNGISTITIQNAYDQLISEGYVYTKPKRGYYVANIEGMTKKVIAGSVHYDIKIPRKKEYRFDFTGNEIDQKNFPFSVWAKVSRETMSERKDELMKIPPVSGTYKLREAIAKHLKSFRGMLVDPDQIVIGAGTEYLYGLITELLGSDKIYTIENPGYKKLVNIYRQREISCTFASLDQSGVTVEELLRNGTEVAHICPNHHFPTGITMPANRRYELLSWANEKPGRYILEDDYDSEFRMVGKPIPTLYSIDACEKVIYINTFSKSLTPTIRVSYMVLPIHLANEFYERMFFYSCTVSNFEQYTLAEFIADGYFEKHINRMRLYYNKKRKRLIDVIENSSLANRCQIIDSDAGLHFLVYVDTKLEDIQVEELLEEKGIKIKAISDYYFTEQDKKQHYFILNYSNLSETVLSKALELVEEIEGSLIV